MPRAAALYVVATIIVGAWVVQRAGVDALRQGGAPAEIAPFLLIATLANVKRLRLSYHAHVSVANAIYLAAVIVFGAPVASLIGAVSQVVEDLRRRKPLHKVAFNGSVIAISIAAGGAVFSAIQNPAGGSLSAQDLLALGAFAAVSGVVNHVLVFAAIALATRTPLRDVVVTNHRGLILSTVSLYPLGLLIALSHASFGAWIGLLVVAIPTITVYRSLENVQLVRGQARAALEALADAVDRRDPYTAEHSQRVAVYAGQMATKLGLSMAALDSVVTAARLHDLGKVTVPDAVLRKQGPLNLDECEQMRDHPAAGAAILERLQVYREAALFVRHHHERLDGMGYPDGLTESALPLGARLLAVADAFDAMTSDRPYRRALPASTALERLREGAGTQFSPEIVEALAATLGADRGDRAVEPLRPVSARLQHARS